MNLSLSKNEFVYPILSHLCFFTIKFNFPNNNHSTRAQLTHDIILKDLLLNIQQCWNSAHAV